MCVNLSQLRYRKRGPTLHDMSTVPLSLSSETVPTANPNGSGPGNAATTSREMEMEALSSLKSA